MWAGLACWGTVLTVAVYLLGSVAVMGVAAP